MNEIVAMLQLLLIVVLVPVAAVIPWRLRRLCAALFRLWGGGIGLIILIMMVVMLLR